MQRNRHAGADLYAADKRAISAMVVVLCPMFWAAAAYRADDAHHRLRYEGGNAPPTGFDILGAAIWL
jgi:hypothetical protein